MIEIERKFLNDDNSWKVNINPWNLVWNDG